LETHFVGHQIFFDKKVLKKRRIITFLPGSRNIEIKNNLLRLKSVISHTSKVYSDYSIYILTFDHSKSMVKHMLKNINVKIITNFGEKQNILSKSFLAIAASGSISLELCKYQVPSIIVYNTHIITRILIKFFVNVRYASIINIHFKKEIIPEYLFEKFTHNNLIKEISILLTNKKKRKKQIEFMNNFSNQMLLKKKNPAEIISDHII
jgi:lipid-A-disaccharide synthase